MPTFEMIVAIACGYMVGWTLIHLIRPLRKPRDHYQALIDNITAYGAAVTLYPAKDGKAEVAIGSGNYNMKPPIRLYRAASHDIALAQALHELERQER